MDVERRDPKALQDQEYWFPYHYIARRDESGFRQSFNDSWGINYLSTIEFMLERVKSAGVTDVVDVGCGDGRFTRELAALPGVARAVGIDYSPRAIGLARAMNQDAAKVKFLDIDITAGRCDEPPFGAAVLMEVLEHIPLAEVQGFVKSVRRLLRGGGRLFLTVPHANMPTEAKHFQHFTSASIARALEGSFSVSQVLPFEREGRRRRLVNALLQNRFFILNHPRTLNALYAWYRRSLFFCPSERECRRLYVEAVAA